MRITKGKLKHMKYGLDKAYRVAGSGNILKMENRWAKLSSVVPRTVAGRNDQPQKGDDRASDGARRENFAINK